MFIGYYKSISSPEEFYSDRRNSLDFPTQVELNKKKYSLTHTYQVETESSYIKLVDSAKRNNIPYDIKVK